MITSDQQAEVVYKILEGKASTNANRSAAEEPLPSGLIFTPQNFWIDAQSIPAVAPALANQGIYSIPATGGGVQNILQYYASVVLQAVSGSTSAFYNLNLRDSIPYNYDPVGSYLYTLKDATGTPLAFGLNNWVVDNQAGVLTFFDGVPSGITLPLTISFYKYIGRKSLQGILLSINTIDGVLDKLLPAAPPGLSSEVLTISGLYTAFQSGTGAIHVDCINNTRPAITPNGPFIDGSVASIPATLAAAYGGQIPPASVAVLTAYIDGAAVGSVTLPPATTPEQVGSLMITQDVDPYLGQVGKQGFYQEIFASIMPPNPLSVSVSAHTAQLTETIGNVASSTPLATFHVDDPQSPTVASIVLTASTPVSYVSGVPTLTVANQINVAFTVANAVRFHYGANGAQLTSASVQGTVFPIAGTPPANGAILSFATGLQVLPNVYTEGASVSIVGLNSMQVAGVASIGTSSIRIDTVSNEVRVQSGIGIAPASFGGVFNPSQSVAGVTINEELQLLNGLYQWPTGDYSNNKPVAGPNYVNVSIPADGYRWVTFQPITLANANGFTLTINGVAGTWGLGSSNSTMGVSIEARVMRSDGITPVTSWVDCNSPYAGVGKPGSVLTRQLDPAMVAGDINTTATSKRVTFGPTVYSGLLFIRIGLTQSGGQKFTSISVQPD